MTKRPEEIATIALREAVEDDAAEAEAARLTSTPWRELRTGVAVLLVWWGVWTLADRVLLRLSPFSEAGAVALGSLLFFWDRVFFFASSRCDSAKVRLHSSLRRI